MKALAGYPIVDVLPGGVEGARYRAKEPDTQRPLNLHVLRPSALTTERRKEIERRLQLLGSWSQVGFTPVVDHRLGAQRPYVAVAVPDGPSLAHWVQGRPDRGELGPVLFQLLQRLNQAHGIGLAHGNLDLETVLLDAERVPWLDLTGLETAPTYGPVGASRGSAEGDVLQMARLLLGLLGLTSSDPVSRLDAPEPIKVLLAQALLADPYERPTIKGLVQGLGAWLSAGAPKVEGPRLEPTLPVDPTRPVGLAGGEPTPSPADPLAPLPFGTILGRYRLEALLGQGSMGDVHRAVELGTGRVVALKVINPVLLREEQILRRFRREARLLDEVRHENVVELYEVNEDQGRVYLALELVEGPSLLEYKRERDHLPERAALWVISEVAKGLAAAHARGIVHRDLKPGNVLLSPQIRTSPEALPFRVRLCDFGIAKRIWAAGEGSHSDLTNDGAVGTPKYMSPEQCTAGAPITPASDVYALGVMLFDLLSGAAPFSAETTAALLFAQIHQPAPRVDVLVPGVSAATADLVEACLAKDPNQRPADAAALVERIRVLLGIPPPVAHPPLPSADPGELMVLSKRYELPATPAQLWPKVSDTERFNQALGLPAVDWTFEPQATGGSVVFGQARQVGLTLRWKERPFEWIEGQRLGVVREYQDGPIEWYASAVELAPTDRGTTRISHQLWVKPQGWLGRAAAFVEVRQRLARRLDQVYQRIGAVVAASGVDGGVTDPFQGEAAPPYHGRLLELGAQLSAPIGVKAPFLDWLAQAPEADVARIRPLALARRLQLPERQVVQMCLEGGANGLLTPLWDVICPTCRIPTTVVESLQAIAAHGRCEACNLGFEVDLARSVELVFRPHPEVRSTQVKTYCIGGPAHSPHAALQLRLQPKERFVTRLDLAAGSYELRVVNSALRWPIAVGPFGSDRLELELGPEAPGHELRALRVGRVELTFTSLSDQEQLVRLERTAARDDAFTAADASAHPLFRRLYPAQTFKADALVGLESITLLLTDLEDPAGLYRARGDAQVLTGLKGLLDWQKGVVEDAGGALVKASGHGIVAAFTSTEDAVQAGLRVLTPSGGLPLPVIAAVHRGRAMAATLDDRLDYFGRSVNHTHRLLLLARSGQLVLSDEVAEDPRIERLWRRSGLEAEVLTLSGKDLELALRLGPSPRNAEVRAD